MVYEVRVVVMEFSWSLILVLTPSPVKMGLEVSVLWVLALGGVSGWGMLIGCGHGIVLAETSLFLMLGLPHSQIRMRWMLVVDSFVIGVCDSLSICCCFE
ncbi:hypothetical protein AHAS_Ahas06G0157000 [Arachis hypogaea]